MSCYHPLRAFEIGVKENGKKKLKVTTFDCDCLVYDKIKRYYEPCYFDKLSMSTKLNGNKKIYRESFPIPCGQCIGCRLDYSREWANRLMLENKYSDESYFVTLTYSDENLPKNDDGIATLCKRDLQLFMKRLRRKFEPDEIRFFSAGEYGSQTARPHYHLILFNLHLPFGDLQFYKRSELGFDYYISPLLAKIWGKGHVIVASVSWHSCAYVARYCVKKKKGKEKDFYDKYNIVPEFTLMSRKPGIASQYIKEHAEELLRDKHIILDDGRVVALPKYSHCFLEENFPDDFEDYKDYRHDLAEEMYNAKVRSSSLSYLELCAEEEKIKNISSKGLDRMKI